MSTMTPMMNQATFCFGQRRSRSPTRSTSGR
jgi:hypothetical protein